MHLAVALAHRHGEETARAAIAALLHDCGRFPTLEAIESEARRRGFEIPEEDRDFPKIWHAALSAHIAETEFGVTDNEILHAIRVHPTGDGEMSRLDKIVFLADYIEPTRKFEGLNELRDLALRDLEEGFREALSRKIRYVQSLGRRLHPRSIAAWRAAGLAGEEVELFSPQGKKRDGSPELKTR